MWQASLQWNSGPIQGSLLPFEPAHGLKTEQPASRILGLSLNGTSLPTTVEHYIRGADLYLACAEDDRHVRVHAYYRSLPGDTPAVELIASVQTSQLGVPVSLTVNSEADGVIQQTDGALLGKSADWGRAITADRGNVFRWTTEDGKSLITQMVYPSDFHTAGAEAGQLTCDLFPSPMEKGVIRSGRIRCYFGDICDDKLANLYAAFLDSPPPLTT
jgi:hypothetical protein